MNKNRNRFQDLLLRKALAEGATQIHLEPLTDGSWRVRVRCGDVPSAPLAPFDWGPLSPELGKQVVNWLKAQSELDPHETRLPQNGRMLVAYNGVDYGVSVSTLPTRRGEVVALEMGLASSPSLDELGLGPSDLSRFRQVLGAGGLVLVTGDRRSGKRSVARACAAFMAVERRTVYSVAAGEPDVGLDGIVQLELRPELGFSRERALRAALSGIPDALRVDLVNTPEVARLVVDAAISGVSVVATMESPDTAHAVLHLLEMGIAPRRLAQALKLVVSSRLPRRLCPCCSRSGAAPATPALWRLVPRLMDERILGAWRQARVAGDGCDCCRNGYRDRVPVFEVLRPTLASVDRVVGAASVEDKLAILRERCRGLREGAMLLAEGGVTSVVEALRVTPPAAEREGSLTKPERANALASL